MQVGLRILQTPLSKGQSKAVNFKYQDETGKRANVGNKRMAEIQIVGNK